MGLERFHFRFAHGLDGPPVPIVFILGGAGSAIKTAGMRSSCPERRVLGASGGIDASYTINHSMVKAAL